MHCKPNLKAEGTRTGTVRRTCIIGTVRTHYPFAAHTAYAAHAVLTVSPTLMEPPCLPSHTPSLVVPDLHSMCQPYGSYSAVLDLLYLCWTAGQLVYILCTCVCVYRVSQASWFFMLPSLSVSQCLWGLLRILNVDS
jgi:hypothetical protein